MKNYLFPAILVVLHASLNKFFHFFVTLTCNFNLMELKQAFHSITEL